MNKPCCYVDDSSSTLMLEGDFTLATMSQGLSQINALIQNEVPKHIDLSRLNLCDSSTVALVMDLRRRGVLHVLHAPLAFAAIVRACQLDALFPDLAQN